MGCETGEFVWDGFVCDDSHQMYPTLAMIHWPSPLSEYMCTSFLFHKDELPLTKESTPVGASPSHGFDRGRSAECSRILSHFYSDQRLLASSTAYHNLGRATRN